MLVEVCANSLASAINAERAGADRIELCVELGVGGITPSYGLAQLVREKLSIPLHILVRPRSGHFSYSNTEFEVMQKDIELFKALGVNGIVSGMLGKDASLDITRTKALVEMTKPLHFTFHRAFDWIADPIAALDQLETIRVDTVLTSGKRLTAELGIAHLKKWQEYTSISIMAGGGIRTNNAYLFKEAGLSALHLSGTTFVNDVPLDHKISMNSKKHLREKHVAVTNTDTIRQIIKTVK